LVGAWFDLLGVGNIHKRAVHSETPWVVMPGMPQQGAISESRAKISDPLDGERRRNFGVPKVARSVVRVSACCDCDLTGVETDEDMRAALAVGRCRRRQGGARHFTIALDGQTSLRGNSGQLAGTPMRAQADEIAESIGTLWIER